jgi:hypothetical protein
VPAPEHAESVEVFECPAHGLIGSGVVWREASGVMVCAAYSDYSSCGLTVTGPFQAVVTRSRS